MKHDGVSCTIIGQGYKVVVTKLVSTRSAVCFRKSSGDQKCPLLSPGLFFKRRQRMNFEIRPHQKYAAIIKEEQKRRLLQHCKKSTGLLVPSRRKGVP